MSEKTAKTTAGIGDLVVIEGHHVGEGRRLGEILEVIGEAGGEHFRVRWEDGRETLFYPSSDATIHPATGRRRTRGPAAAAT